MSSTGSEVAIVAIIKPAAGKLDRLRELLKTSIDWIQANEPGTLEFSVWEEANDEGVKFFMFEKYASKAALDEHENSEEYEKLFKIMSEEGILAGAPVFCRGKPHCGFTR